MSRFDRRGNTATVLHLRLIRSDTQDRKIVKELEINQIELLGVREHPAVKMGFDTGAVERAELQRSWDLLM